MIFQRVKKERNYVWLLSSAIRLRALITGNLLLAIYVYVCVLFPSRKKSYHFLFNTKIICQLPTIDVRPGLPRVATR